MFVRNYTIGDIKHILKNGKVIKFTKEGKEIYRCKIHGDDPEGFKGTVVTIVISNKKLIVVTVLGGI